VLLNTHGLAQFAVTVAGPERDGQSGRGGGSADEEQDERAHGGQQTGGGPGAAPGPAHGAGPDRRRRGQAPARPPAQAVALAAHRRRCEPPIPTHPICLADTTARITVQHRTAHDVGGTSRAATLCSDRTSWGKCRVVPFRLPLPLRRKMFGITSALKRADGCCLRAQASC